jgi:hypothetical protein
MTRKQKSYKELETENTRGKKRYLERLVEDEEAAQRIDEFLDQPNQPEESEHEQPRTNPFS